MNLKKLQINLQVGQSILVGPKNEPATITKIEQHGASGDITINTTKGTRKVLTFRLLQDNQTDNVADRYR